MEPEFERGHGQDALRKPTKTTDQAEIHRLSVVDIISKHGKDDAASLMAMENLAGLYWCENMRDYAIKVQRKALDWREEADDPPDTFNLPSMDTLATMYFEEGQFRQAEKILLRSMELRAKAAYANPSRTFEAKFLLQKTYEKQGKTGDSLRNLWELLELLLDVAGMKGKREDALRSLCELLGLLSNAAGMEAKADDALRNLREVLGLLLNVAVMEGKTGGSVC